MNHLLNASVSDCEYMYRILYEFYVKDSWKYYKEGFRIVPSTIKKVYNSMCVSSLYVNVQNISQKYELSI